MYFDFEKGRRQDVLQVSHKWIEDPDYALSCSSRLWYTSSSWHNLNAHCKPESQLIFTNFILQIRHPVEQENTTYIQGQTTTATYMRCHFIGLPQQFAKFIGDKFRWRSGLIFIISALYHLAISLSTNPNLSIDKSISIREPISKWSNCHLWFLFKNPQVKCIGWWIRTNPL